MGSCLSTTKSTALWAVQTMKSWVSKFETGFRTCLEYLTNFVEIEEDIVKVGIGIEVGEEPSTSVKPMVITEEIDVDDVNNINISLHKQPKKIPEHLRSVHVNHLEQLRGFEMMYSAKPNGACLTNCLTAHIYCTDDEEECKKMNKRVNEHIADNFDDYYQEKIILPYIETVGVGENARLAVCDTPQEYKTFLRSDDSLGAFSNFQELQAIANMFNINVYIFSYGKDGNIMHCDWFEDFPDKAFTDKAVVRKGSIPDLYLYHLDRTHYDLLVSEDHRVALTGLVTKKLNNIVENYASLSYEEATEILLVDSDTEDYDVTNLDELSNAVNIGHKEEKM